MKPEDNMPEWFSQQENMSKGLLGVILAFGVLSLVFFSIGIRGATKFNTCMVATAMIYHGVSAVVNLIALNIFGMLLSVLFLYPHVMLLLEMRNGIMTVENYPNEKKGCCA